MVSPIAGQNTAARPRYESEAVTDSNTRPSRPSVRGKEQARAYGHGVSQNAFPQRPLVAAVTRHKIRTRWRPSSPLILGKGGSGGADVLPDDSTPLAGRRDTQALAVSLDEQRHREELTAKSEADSNLDWSRFSTYPC